MSFRVLSRCGVSLLFLAFLAGCSTGVERMKCKLSPSSCMYEGSYEEGEEEFAEQEAKDLNKAQSRKVRRQSKSL